jgi:DNA-binding transcriptional LysR family regulator
MGLTVLPEWLIGQRLAEKRLELVLSGLAISRGQLFGVYPSRKYVSAEVRTCLDFVTQDYQL